MNELNILFKARNTVLEMLRDRGYSISKDTNCVSIKDLRTRYMNKNCDIHVDKPNHCYVKFIHHIKLRPNSLKECIQSIKEDILPERGELIIVCRNKPNSTLEKICKESRNTQIFWINRLVVNITKHHLMPKFKMINESDIHSILDKYHIQSRYQLPIMLKSDPVSQYFGFPVGTVCEIERSSITAGTHISYRCVK